MKLFIAFAVTAWLVIGIAAAGQRGYYGNDLTVSCRTGAELGLTIASGPLNYVGLNPKVHCKAPHPSL